MTSVVRLRMEVVTDTRIIRRVVDVSARTTLPTVVRIIRTARDWWEHRDYRLKIGSTVYGEGKRRGEGVRQAKGRQLGDALGEHDSLELVHNITRGTTQTVEVRNMGKTDEPETAFPRLVEAAGVLATEDLTPDDGDHELIRTADEATAWNRVTALELLADDRKRAERSQRLTRALIDQVRHGRRGPLRSHQPGSRRLGGDGVPPEPETEPRRPAAHRQPIVIRPRPDSPKPAAEARDGEMRLIDEPSTASHRQQAWMWHPENVDDDDDGIAELHKLATRAPTDITVLAVYGAALEAGNRGRDAIDVYRQAFELGTACLPENFRGRISQETEAGMALLEASAGLGRCECTHAARGRGIAVLERLAAWDDDPRNEAALRLGSEYLHAGQLQKARAHIERELGRSFHPPYDYDLGLCEFLEERWPEAAGALTRGLATNPHIAEVLLGVKTLWGIVSGIPEWGRDRETAIDYGRYFSWLWKRTDGALEFLRWVQTHPETMVAVATTRSADLAAACGGTNEGHERLRESYLARVRTMTEAGRTAMETDLRHHGPRPWDAVPAARREPW